MIHLGIDPGQKGAVGLVDDAGSFELVADLPLITDKSLTWIDGGALQSLLLDAIGGRPCRAIVEREGA